VANFTLTVTATATEAANGDHATTAPQSIFVTLNAATDLPTLTVTGFGPGPRGHRHPLAISGALARPDGTQTLSFTLTGIPGGAAFRNTAGDSLTVSNGQLVLTPAQVAGLQITPPAQSDAAFTITVTATATEAANGDRATAAPQTIAVTVRAVADLPTLTVSGTASGNQDTAIPLAISGALTDTDGSEDLSFTVAGIPSGATLHNPAGNLLAGQQRATRADTSAARRLADHAAGPERRGLHLDGHGRGDRRRPTATRRPRDPGPSR